MSQKDGDRRNENMCQGLMENEGKNIGNILLEGIFSRMKICKSLFIYFCFYFF